MASNFDKFTSSRFYEMGEELGNIIILSLLWVVFSLPIITIGPSSAALYYVIHKLSTDESVKLVSSFWHSFLSNLKQGILLSVITILFIGITAINMYIGKNGYNGIEFPDWYFPVSFIPLIAIVFILPYLFPYLARFSDTTGKILKNCFTFGTINMFNSFELSVLIVAASAAIWFFPPCILVVPYIVCRISHYLCEKPFETILKLMDRRAHPEKYADENKDTDESSDLESEDDEDYDEYDEDEDLEEYDDDDDDSSEEES